MVLGLANWLGFEDSLLFTFKIIFNIYLTYHTLNFIWPFPTIRNYLMFDPDARISYFSGSSGYVMSAGDSCKRLDKHVNKLETQEGRK